MLVIVAVLAVLMIGPLLLERLERRLDTVHKGGRDGTGTPPPPNP
jgi:hypothetical protein